VQSSFPLVLFAPSEWTWRIVGAPLIGGQPISGPPQTAEVTGGGYWMAEWTPALLSPSRGLAAWRAIVAELSSGVSLLEVPVLDALQPWPAGVAASLVPFSDGSTFDDLSEFFSDAIDATLFADAYMPASPAPPAPPTQAQIEFTAGGALMGGEYFTVVGPSGFAKLHMVTRILSTAGNVATVCVRPPFREDMAAGTLVDFNRPRCVMKADLSSVEKAWPRMRSAMVSEAAITFMESGFVTPSSF
jgi:hypothetical protein